MFYPVSLSEIQPVVMSLGILCLLDYIFFCWSVKGALSITFVSHSFSQW